MDETKIKVLTGANMDVDLVSENVGWDQSICPWNEAENTKEHKCAVKNISICIYFVASSIWTAFSAVIRMEIKTNKRKAV
jgi:hypothetical protein